MLKHILSTTIVSCGLAGALAIVPACRNERREPVRAEEPRAVPTTPTTPTTTAEPGRTDPAKTAETTTKRDNEAAKVLATLHQDNRNEIELGKLAQQKGLSAETRQFGTMLVRDHQEADRKIMAYAKENNLVLDSGDAAKESEDKAKEGREVMEKLQPLRGAEFDKEFGEAMKDDHQKAVELVKDAQKDVQDAKLKALLAEIQPSLEKHLEHAKMIEEGKTAATTDDKAKRQGRRTRPERPATDDRPAAGEERPR